MVKTILIFDWHFSMEKSSRREIPTKVVLRKKDDRLLNKKAQKKAQHASMEIVNGSLRCTSFLADLSPFTDYF